jgi:hypothetical protein
MVMAFLEVYCNICLEEPSETMEHFSKESLSPGASRTRRDVAIESAATFRRSTCISANWSEHVNFEVLTAVTYSCDVKPRRLVYVYWSFEGTCWTHVQDRRIKPWNSLIYIYRRCGGTYCPLFRAEEWNREDGACMFTGIMSGYLPESITSYSIRQISSNLKIHLVPQFG